MAVWRHRWLVRAARSVGLGKPGGRSTGGVANLEEEAHVVANLEEDPAVEVVRRAAGPGKVELQHAADRRGNLACSFCGAVERVQYQWIDAKLAGNSRDKASCHRC